MLCPTALSSGAGVTPAPPNVSDFSAILSWNKDFGEHLLTFALLS
jgi:hypothetical protein